LIVGGGDDLAAGAEAEQAVGGVVGVAGECDGGLVRHRQGGAIAGGGIFILVAPAGGAGGRRQLLCVIVVAYYAIYPQSMK